MPKHKSVNIVVHRIPRATPITDLPPSFPPQDNLKLDLLENKLKLKKGAPSVPRKRVTKKTRSDTKHHAVAEQPRANAVLDPQPGGANHSPLQTSHIIPAASPQNALGNQPPGQASLPTPASQPPFAAAPPQVSPVTVIVGTGFAAQGAVPSVPVPASPEDNVEEEIKDDEPELSPEEKEARDIDEYLWRFKILKKKYPKAQVPEYTKHSDLLEMKVTYDRTIKELNMEDCLSSYKNYIIMALWGIETMCGWSGIDIKDFAKNERKALEKHHEYDKFLIEMGEKSYSSWGMSFPVEIRLVLFVLFKMITYFVVKHMLGGMFEESSPRKKRAKMRGPSISINEIRDSREEETKKSEGSRQRRPNKLDEQD
jgi:hypothetical protein